MMWQMMKAPMYMDRITVTLPSKTRKIFFKNLNSLRGAFDNRVRTGGSAQPHLFGADKKRGDRRGEESQTPYRCHKGNNQHRERLCPPLDHPYRGMYKLWFMLFWINFVVC